MELGAQAPGEDEQLADDVCWKVGGEVLEEVDGEPQVAESFLGGFAMPEISPLQYLLHRMQRHMLLLTHHLPHHLHHLTLICPIIIHKPLYQLLQFHRLPLINHTTQQIIHIILIEVVISKHTHL